MTTTIPETQAPVTSEWAGAPISASQIPAQDAVAIPLEQFRKGRDYVYRMELPGVDPAEGLIVYVRAGVLSVRATRKNEQLAGHNREFGSGACARNITLPFGANMHDITADFRNGILTVRVEIDSGRSASPHVVPVTVR